MTERNNRPQIREGYMDFCGYKTYYRIVGECTGTKKPLLLLHGGPGSAHDAFEVLDPLAEDGRAVIMYDQIGCGRSQAPGRRDLFNRYVWRDELIALREHLNLKELHLLGHSWGGMLLLDYVLGKQPEGLKSLILASPVPGVKFWSTEQRRMNLELPQEMQDIIAEADRTGDYFSDAYQWANAEYIRRHCCPDWPEDAPECLKRPGNGYEAWLTSWGPTEFQTLGNLGDFERIDDLKYIRQPSLITSGVMDTCTPLIAKRIHDEIPGSRWELFAHSRHMAFAEENGAYLRLLRDWMTKYD